MDFDRGQDPGRSGDATADLALDERQLTSLTAALADQFTALYDYRPIDPRAVISGNVLTFTFDGALSRSDELLLSRGRGDQVERFRSKFMGAIGGQLEEVVEALAGVQVSSLLTAFDPSRRLTECVFILDGELSAKQEQRQALVNWADQVRRNAKEVRARHREAREAHSRLIHQLGEAPRARDDSDDD